MYCNVMGGPRLNYYIMLVHNVLDDAILYHIIQYHAYRNNHARPRPCAGGGALRVDGTNGHPGWGPAPPGHAEGPFEPGGLRTRNHMKHVI